MSTRADFYIGRGPGCTWVGSIGHDAFVHDIAPYFETADTEDAFRAALAKVFQAYGEISADCGWPWPWESSGVTGQAVAFDAGVTWVSYRSRWVAASAFADTSEPDVTGAERCVFPDLVREEASTPEGVLRQALRRGTRIRLKAGVPVLPAMLARIAYLLSRAWMHSHEAQAEGQVRMLSPLYSLQDEVFDLRRVLLQHQDTVQNLVASQQAADGNPAWALVSWACEHLRPYFQGESVQVALTDDLPVQFGQPPQRRPDANIQLPERLHLHVEPLDDAYRLGRERWAEVLAEVPSLYGYALAHELQSHGVLPVPDAELDAWLERPMSEQSPLTWTQAGATAEGRAQACRQASDLFWR